MQSPLHYLPIATTLLAGGFATVVLGRALAKGRSPHLMWWAFGLFVYGLGTLFESDVTLVGWTPWAFRGWYVAGALLGGLPLAQGTVHLLLKRRVANALSAIVVPAAILSAIAVLASPLDLSRVQEHRLAGDVLAWTWVRVLPAFLNTYAFVFLVGGAALSAWRYARAKVTRARAWGNVLIAVGALLPGIGGSLTVAGDVEALYVTELIGLVLIFAGYEIIVRSAPPPARAPAPAAGAEPHP